MTEGTTHRRWFQFRLRTLLIVVLVLSLPLSWFGARLRKARRQRAAVEAIERAGGSWFYYCSTSGFSTQPYPTWLRGLLGDDFLFNVKMVDCGKTDFCDEEARHLSSLPDLEWAILHDTQLTDTGLQCLEGLTRLQYLDLEGTNIGDAGLEHLAGLTHLEVLSLDGTSITDARLEHLKGLINLVLLSLDSTQVSDAGLEHLRGLGLQMLILENTHVTPEGVKKLREALPNCEIEY